MAVRNSVICEICGKEGAGKRRVTRSYGRGGSQMNGGRKVHMTYAPKTIWGNPDRRK